MKHIHFSRLCATLALVAFVSAAVPFSSAQTADPIRLTVGEVFEITTDTSSPTAQFNWILTKDRSFQSAARTKFFQSRLTVPGTYVLDVSVQDPITSENAYRAFTIVVSEGVPPQPPVRNEGQPQAILGTDKPGNAGIGLPVEGGLVKIDPSPSSGVVDRFSLDLDTTVDSDTNGNPQDDKDTLGTSLEQVGTPIYVYMLPRPGREIMLTVSNNRGDPESIARLPVSFGVVIGGVDTGTVQQAGPITATNENGRLRLRVAVDPNVVAGKELLYEWDFGDRTKSLLTSPVHQYAVAGTYAVTVSIRDIASGETILRSSQNVVVNADAATVSSSLSSSAANTPDAEESESSFGLGSIVKVALIVLLLLAFALGLYVLLLWLKRKTASGLQGTLEKLEGTIVKNDDAKAPEVVETMKVTRPVTPPPQVKAQILTMEEVSEKEKQRPELKSKTAEPIATTNGPMPEWLKPKSATTPAEPAPKEQAKPVAVPPPVAKPATPTPTPAPAVKSPAPTQSNPPEPNGGPVPDWLKPKPVVTEVQTAPKTEPQPKPLTPTQPPQPIQKPVPPPPPPQPAPKLAPAPVPQPTPKPLVQPTVPNATAAPKPTTPPISGAIPEQKKDEGEPPIAIISADSLKK